MAVDEARSRNDGSLDFLSSNFDPLRALYRQDLTPLFPKIHIFNNLAEYARAIKEGKIKPKSVPKPDDGGPSKRTRNLKPEFQPSSAEDKPKALSDGKEASCAEGGSKKSGGFVLGGEVRGSAGLGGRVVSMGGLGEGRRWKKHMNVLDKMQACAVGPFSILYRCVEERLKLRVWTRRYKGLRSVLSGYLIAFDKHMNLALMDVDEVYTLEERIHEEVPENESCTVKKKKKKKKRRGKKTSGETAPEIVEENSTLAASKVECDRSGSNEIATTVKPVDPRLQQRPKPGDKWDRGREHHRDPVLHPDIAAASTSSLSNSAPTDPRLRRRSKSCDGRLGVKPSELQSPADKQETPSNTVPCLPKDPRLLRGLCGEQKSSSVITERSKQKLTDEPQSSGNYRLADASKESSALPSGDPRLGSVKVHASEKERIQSSSLHRQSRRKSCEGRIRMIPLDSSDGENRPRDPRLLVTHSNVYQTTSRTPKSFLTLNYHKRIAPLLSKMSVPQQYKEKSGLPKREILATKHVSLMGKTGEGQIISSVEKNRAAQDFDNHDVTGFGMETKGLPSGLRADGFSRNRQASLEGISLPQPSRETESDLSSTVSTQQTSSSGSTVGGVLPHCLMDIQGEAVSSVQATDSGSTLLAEPLSAELSTERPSFLFSQDLTVHVPSETRNTPEKMEVTVVGIFQPNVKSEDTKRNLSEDLEFEVPIVFDKQRDSAQVITQSSVDTSDTGVVLAGTDSCVSRKPVEGTFSRSKLQQGTEDSEAMDMDVPVSVATQSVEAQEELGNDSVPSKAEIASTVGDPRVLLPDTDSCLSREPIEGTFSRSTLEQGTEDPEEMDIDIPVNVTTQSYEAKEELGNDSVPFIEEVELPSETSAVGDTTESTKGFDYDSVLLNEVTDTSATSSDECHSKAAVPLFEQTSMSKDEATVDKTIDASVDVKGELGYVSVPLNEGVEDTSTTLVGLCHNEETALLFEQTSASKEDATVDKIVDTCISDTPVRKTVFQGQDSKIENNELAQINVLKQKQEIVDTTEKDTLMVSSEKEMVKCDVIETAIRSIDGEEISSHCFDELPEKDILHKNIHQLESDSRATQIELERELDEGDNEVDLDGEKQSSVDQYLTLEEPITSNAVKCMDAEDPVSIADDKPTPALERSEESSPGKGARLQGEIASSLEKASVTDDMTMELEESKIICFMDNDNEPKVLELEQGSPSHGVGSEGENQDSTNQALISAVEDNCTNLIQKTESAKTDSCISASEEKDQDTEEIATLGKQNYGDEIASAEVHQESQTEKGQKVSGLLACQNESAEEGELSSSDDDEEGQIRRAEKSTADETFERATASEVNESVEKLADSDYTSQEEEGQLRGVDKRTEDADNEEAEKILNTNQQAKRNDEDSDKEEGEITSSDEEPPISSTVEPPIVDLHKKDSHRHKQDIQSKGQPDKDSPSEMRKKSVWERLDFGKRIGYNTSSEESECRGGAKGRTPRTETKRDLGEKERGRNDGGDVGKKGKKFEQGKDKRKDSDSNQERSSKIKQEKDSGRGVASRRENYSAEHLEHSSKRSRNREKELSRSEEESGSKASVKKERDRSRTRDSGNDSLRKRAASLESLAKQPEKKMSQSCSKKDDVKQSKEVRRESLRHGIEKGRSISAERHSGEGRARNDKRGVGSDSELKRSIRDVQTKQTKETPGRSDKRMDKRTASGDEKSKRSSHHSRNTEKSIGELEIRKVQVKSGKPNILREDSKGTYEERRSVGTGNVKPASGEKISSKIKEQLSKDVRRTDKSSETHVSRKGKEGDLAKCDKGTTRLKIVSDVKPKEDLNRERKRKKSLENEAGRCEKARGPPQRGKRDSRHSSEERKARYSRKVKQEGGETVRLPSKERKERDTSKGGDQRVKDLSKGKSLESSKGRQKGKQQDGETRKSVQSEVTVKDKNSNRGRRNRESTGTNLEEPSVRMEQNSSKRGSVAEKSRYGDKGDVCHETMSSGGNSELSAKKEGLLPTPPSWGRSKDTQEHHTDAPPMATTSIRSLKEKKDAKEGLLPTPPSWGRSKDTQEHHTDAPPMATTSIRSLKEKKDAKEGLLPTPPSWGRSQNAHKHGVDASLRTVTNNRSTVEKNDSKDGLLPTPPSLGRSQNTQEHDADPTIKREDSKEGLLPTPRNWGQSQSTHDHDEAVPKKSELVPITCATSRRKTSDKMEDPIKNSAKLKGEENDRRNEDRHPRQQISQKQTHALKSKKLATRTLAKKNGKPDSSKHEVVRSSTGSDRKRKVSSVDAEHRKSKKLKTLDTSTSSSNLQHSQTERIQIENIHRESSDEQNLCLSDKDRDAKTGKGAELAASDHTPPVAEERRIMTNKDKYLVFKRRHVNQLFVRGDNVVMVAYAS